MKMAVNTPTTITPILSSMEVSALPVAPMLSLMVGAEASMVREYSAKVSSDEASRKGP